MAYKDYSQPVFGQYTPPMQQPVFGAWPQQQIPYNAPQNNLYANQQVQQQQQMDPMQMYDTYQQYETLAGGGEGGGNSWLQGLFGGGGAAGGGVPASLGGASSPFTASSVPASLGGASSPWAAGGSVAGGGGAAGGAGGGGGLAAAGPWAALAAVIGINEEEARKSGYRDDNSTDRVKDIFSSKVLEQDAERWSDMAFGKDGEHGWFGKDDEYGLGADGEMLADVMTLDFSNAWDTFKNDSSLSKLLDIF